MVICIYLMTNNLIQRIYKTKLQYQINLRINNSNQLIQLLNKKNQQELRVFINLVNFKNH